MIYLILKSTVGSVLVDNKYMSINKFCVVLTIRTNYEFFFDRSLLFYKKPIF